MSWIAANGPSTMTLIVVWVVRACASETVHGSDFPPALVPGAIVVENENVLSPPPASPFEPSSKNACEAGPPIAVRSQSTARPVLAGFVPGVTDTVSSVDPPGRRDCGLDAPVAVGDVDRQ